MDEETLIEYVFDSQPLTEEEKIKIQTARIAFSQLKLTLDGVLPDGRYKSIVMTKLEEAAMFATKSVSHA